MGIFQRLLDKWIDGSGVASMAFAAFHTFFWICNIWIYVFSNNQFWMYSWNEGLSMIKPEWKEWEIIKLEPFTQAGNNRSNIFNNILLKQSDSLPISNLQIWGNIDEFRDNHTDQIIFLVTRILQQYRNISKLFSN